MDSTIIGCECLDELADFAGAQGRVSAITERAMRGEIDFEGALRERVAMLKGLPLGGLATLLRRAGAPQPRRARRWSTTMARHGARCVLVSGGFTFFTRRVAEAAGFHGYRANILIQTDGSLTGRVGEPILGKRGQARHPGEETRRWRLERGRSGGRRRGQRSGDDPARRAWASPIAPSRWSRPRPTPGSTTPI